jgi:methyl-accepting chemotaxis protein
MRDIIGSSRKGAALVDVLDAIAFQSDILALNASVAAASGPVDDSEFVLVADEVRDLARRGAVAAKTVPSDEQGRGF